MRYYTVVARLSGALAGAVAVEWTDRDAPIDSGRGWEPCLRRADGGWRFASHDPADPAGPHRRAPGVFGRLAIRYRLEPAGPWSEAAPARKAVVILGEGEEETGPSEPPALLVAPTLSGQAGDGAEARAEIGTALAVEPGEWSGLPAPDLAFRWRRDGVEIPGATGPGYTPAPGDDGAALDCRVTATNAAGLASALTGALRVAWPAPRLRAPLAEALLDEDDGHARLDAAAAFEGGALVYALAAAPAGVAIDPATGAIELPLLPAADVRLAVIATNSGGAATAEIAYTVRARPPAAPAAADAAILRSLWRPEGQTTTFSPLVAFPGLPGVAAENLQWTAAPNFEGAEWEHNWHPMLAAGTDAGAEVFELRASPATEGADPSLWNATNTARLTRLRFRRRLAPGRSWSAASAVFTVPAPVVAPTLVAPLPLVESPVGTPATLEAAAHFSGTGLVFAKVAGQAWITVDAASGRVSFATPATAGTTAYTISATNAAGSVQAAGSFSGVVPLAAPTLVAPLPALESPVGTPATLEAAAHFSGTGLVFAKVAGPAWITVDAASGQVSFATPATAGTTAYTISATNAAGSVQAAGSFTRVVAPVSNGLLPLPPAAILAAALGEGNITYNFTAHDGAGGGTRFKSSATTILCLIAAQSGHAASQAYILGQLRFWAGGANTAAGNRLPSGRGGVNMQHDMVLVMCVAVAARIPAIWNALTAAEKNRLDLVMKGLMATCCWQNSDNNVYVKAGIGTNERRIDGGQYGRGRVLNFTHPSVIVPVIVSAYMGGDTPGANATQFLETFDRAQFANQLQAAGIFDMWTVYSAVRATDGRSGPTFAQFEAALRGYAYRGQRLNRAADIRSLVLAEITRHWSRTFKPGLTVGSSVASQGCQWRQADGWGIFENVNAAGTPRTGNGRGAPVGRMLDMTKWAQHKFQGQVGMAPALDGTDGGDGLGGNQPRSSMVYAHDECRGILMSIATLVSLGMLDRTDADLKAGFERMGRGVWDLQFKNEHGYRSFAKGGALWDGGQTSGDWTKDSAVAASYRLPALYSLWLDVVAPWYGG